MTLVQRLIALVTVILMPLALVEAYNASRLVAEREAQIERDAQRILSAVQGEELRLVDGVSEVLFAATREAPAAITSREACASLVSERRLSWLSLSVLDSEGIVRCARTRSELGADLSLHPEFVEALRSRAIAIGDIQAGPFVDQPYLPVALGWGSAQGGGVVLAAVDLNRLARAFSQEPLPADAAFLIADRTGRIVAAIPEGRSRVGEMLPAPIVPLTRADMAGTARARWVDGSERIIAYAPVTASPVRGTSITVGISVAEAMASLQAASRRAGLLFLATLVAAVLVAWWCGVAFIRRPIRVLTEAARRMGQGERGARARLGGRTELAALGAEFDRMAEAIEAGEHRAERADREKTRFLAAASHDLRQPLQAALMFAHVVERQVADSPQGRDAAAKLTRTLDDMRELLDSLLDVSRMDAGLVPPDVSDFAVLPVLERAAAASRAAAEAKGLLLTTTGSDAVVRSDPTVLGRILRNLVENAVRYTDRGGVLIDCRPKGKGELLIEVKDTGSGIPEDQLELIWEEFHQLDRNPERDRRAGLGLGLAIVRRLVRMLGHGVEVASRPGQGTTFTLTLPLVSLSGGTARAGRDARRPEPMPTRTALRLASGTGPVVLLIEDDMDILIGLLDAMVGHGYRVSAARNTAQAIAMAEAGPVPEIIVADYRLPGGERGTDAVQAVRRATGRQQKGVLLTGDIGLEPLEAARAIGMPVLRKPVTARQMLEALERLTLVEA
jgi:signal transduction histidine kinase/CheY-like chemotaxis protein